MVTADAAGSAKNQFGTSLVHSHSSDSFIRLIHPTNEAHMPFCQLSVTSGLPRSAHFWTHLTPHQHLTLSHCHTVTPGSLRWPAVSSPCLRAAGGAQPQSHPGTNPSTAAAPRASPLSLVGMKRSHKPTNRPKPSQGFQHHLPAGTTGTRCCVPN